MEGHSTTITDTIALTEDLNGIRKGDIDDALRTAREFGLYTVTLSKHSDDMEANIGADHVTCNMNAEYGFSSRNTKVNRIIVTKRYMNANGTAVTSGSVTLGLFRVLENGTEEQVGNDSSYTFTSEDNGIHEFQFTELPAGKYILEEKIGDNWYAYNTTGIENPISLNGQEVYVSFADGEIVLRNVNENVNYFGDIDQNVDLPQLIDKAREGTIVVGNPADYDALVTANQQQNIRHADILLAGVDYSKTYNITSDMQRIKAFSERLADATSSKSVRVINMKLSDIKGDIPITGDGRYVVLNIDVTGEGSYITPKLRTVYNGTTLGTLFGADGKEDANKILYNFITRDAQGNAHAYHGHLDPDTGGAGVLLAPDAVIGKLSGDWSGTIICRECQHSGAEIHSNNQNKILNINTLLTNTIGTPELGNLELRKAIVGDVNDRTTWFTFKVEMKDNNGQNVDGSFIATGLKPGEGDSVTFTSGVALVKVRAENSVTISGIPAGYTYHVSEVETEESDFFQLIQIENGDGEITQDGAIESGKTVVAVESLRYGGVEITAHADPTDADQSVYYPEIHTTLADPKTGSHEVVADAKVTLTDEVTYENLVADGRSYVMTGVLILKDGEEYEILMENGKPVTSKVTFKPESASGKVAVSFTLNASSLAGCRVVAFEECADAKTGAVVAIHKDMNDEDQTVVIKEKPAEPTPTPVTPQIPSVPSGESLKGDGTITTAPIKTGDSSRTILWIALMCAAGTAGILVAKKRLRK